MTDREQVPSITKRLAGHVAATSLRSVPAGAIEAARRALLDAIGVSLAATGLSPEAGPYRAVASDYGAGPCRLLGATVRVGPVAAAFANAALAHTLDFGDTFDRGPAHPHAALVPALLAVAEIRHDLTTGALLVALATGSDLACRLSLAPFRPFEDAGWYPPPLVNLVAAAAACAKALGLGEDAIAAAIGLALLGASFPAALKHDRSSQLRGLREAFAARGAVEAALLAQAGAGGFDDPLGGAGGFFEVYAGGVRAEVLFDRLGEHFLGTEVSFKPWPACRGTHPYIEAALDIGRSLDPRMIDAIEAGVGPIQEMLLGPLPERLSAIQAKFSIPYTVAIALREGRVDLDSFGDDRLRDRRIRDLARRVEGQRVAGWGRDQAASGTLKVTLADGTVHRREVLSALGSPERPLSDDALVAKFVQCAARSAKPLSQHRSLAAAEAILAAPIDSPAAALFASCGSEAGLSRSSSARSSPRD